MERIRLSRPTIDDQTKKELMETLDSGWFGNGPKTAELEELLAKKIGMKYCVCTNSGTAALHLALIAYDIKGGELITTPLTFVSDVLVGEYQGMDVTFADIKEDDLCIDPETIKVTEKTKAIIAVDSHGRRADYKRIKQISNRSATHEDRPLLIEDAAHAMYTEGIGKDADILMLSFQAVKTMPTADGGALLTNDEEVYKKLRSLRWLNVEKSTYERHLGSKYTWNYDISRGEGIKAYMNDIQATIALGQLRRLDETLAKRRSIQAVYNYAFKDIPQIKVPMFSETVQYWTMQCENRDKLSEHLEECGIDTSVHFKPLSEMSYWKKAKKTELPVTDRVWLKLLSLPVHDALTALEQEKVIREVKSFYAKN